MTTWTVFSIETNAVIASGLSIADATAAAQKASTAPYREYMMIVGGRDYSASATFATEDALAADRAAADAKPHVLTPNKTLRFVGNAPTAAKIYVLTDAEFATISGS